MKVVAVLLAVFIVFFLLCSVGIFHYQASFFDMGQQAVGLIGKVGDVGSSVFDFLFPDGAFTYLFVKDGVRYYLTSDSETSGSVVASNVSGASSFAYFGNKFVNLLSQLWIYDSSGSRVFTKYGRIHMRQNLSQDQINIWLEGGDLP